ncbi:MAG: glycosyltransferase [Eudoraea sp.]|nr:glycosyltransferase [Eudoraea sp.]
MKRFVYGILKKFKFLPPEWYVKIYYEYYTGKNLDLENPIEFNEKIQWLKVYYKPEILTQLVDKYAVREYVKEKLNEGYLNTLLAVYYKASAVDLDALPERFVIKGAHGYNFNLLVKDKSKLNKTKARYLMHKWMSKNQYYRGGLEWAYKNVQPKLIAEAYLEQIGKSVLDDYKFFCFNGVPKFVQIDMGRGQEDLKAFYDMDWKKLAFGKGIGKKYEGELSKPEELESMIEAVKKLAMGFPFVRVDLYNIDGRILFGEMTFYPGDGRQEFYPDEYNKIIGDYLTLPPLNGAKFSTAYPC